MKIKLLFDQRTITLYNPRGIHYPFPLELGDIVSFICDMNKIPASYGWKEYHNDVRWVGDFFPFPENPFTYVDEDSSIAIKAQIVNSPNEEIELRWHVSHEDTFLGFAVGDQFDYFDSGPFLISMLVRIQAYVHEIWPVETDGEDWDEFVGLFLPCGHKIGNLISQDVEILEIQYFEKE